MRAESPLYASSKRRRDTSRSVRTTVLIGTGVLAVVAVLVGLAYAGSQQRLAEGTRIAGVDVGGLSEHQAEVALAKRFARVASEPVAFTAGGHTFRFTADQLGVELDWRAAVQSAAREGEGFGPLRGFRRLHTRFFGAQVSPPVAVSDGALEYALDQIARSVDRPAADPRLTWHGRTVKTVPGHGGAKLDRTEAAQTLVRSLGSLERGPDPVALPVLTTTPGVTAAMLAPAANRARVVVSAPVTIRGRGERWRLSLERLTALLSLPSGGETRLSISGRAADAYFLSLARRVDVPARNAGFATADAAISIVPSRRGVELDVPATARALLRAATSTTDRVAQLVLRTAAPTRTTADVLAMGIDQRMGTYMTYYAGTADRITNLRLGVEALDGTLVPPGGTFSLNRAIGERTAARGFRPAPVILGTTYGEEIGGGTSQVATTTFNAAWEAGLQITERNPHALYISRYPLGRDATVYWPTLDLKFRNDTKHWVLVKGYAESYGVRVSIYGGEHRRVVSSPGTRRITGPIPVKRIKDPALPKGETVVEQEGEPPSTTSVTRTVYDANGKLLRAETWNTSYKAEQTIVRVGTKPPKTKAKGQAEKPGSAQTTPTPGTPTPPR